MNENLIELEQILQNERIAFKECNSRMDYGMIGHLYRNGIRIAMIFGGSFHIYDSNTAINKPFLKMMAHIQTEFENVSRDIHGTIAPVELGYIEALQPQ